MIKTLQITGAIAAILAVGFLVFPVLFGIRSDEEAEKFLNSPGAIEKFKNSTSQGKTKGGSKVSPLVKEAQAFALYLNPPPPPRPRHRTSKAKRVATVPRPRGEVSAKFKLIATSCYAARPQLSFALIDEPGKGLHWVRQSGKVGHLVIEQVKDGLIIVRDGKETRQVEAEQRPPQINLLQDTSVGKTVKPLNGATLKQPDRLAVKPPKRQTARVPARRPQPSAEEKALAEEFIRTLDTIFKRDKSDTEPNEAEKTELVEGLFSTFETKLRATHINAEEGKRLNRLGEELKGPQQDANQTADRSAKVKASSPKSKE